MVTNENTTAYGPYSTTNVLKDLLPKVHLVNALIDEKGARLNLYKITNRFTLYLYLAPRDGVQHSKIEMEPFISRYQLNFVVSDTVKSPRMSSPRYEKLADDCCNMCAEAMLQNAREISDEAAEIGGVSKDDAFDSISSIYNSFLEGTISSTNGRARYDRVARFTSSTAFWKYDTWKNLLIHTRILREQNKDLLSGPALKPTGTFIRNAKGQVTGALLEYRFKTTWPEYAKMRIEDLANRATSWDWFDEPEAKDPTVRRNLSIVSADSGTTLHGNKATVKCVIDPGTAAVALLPFIDMYSVESPRIKAASEIRTHMSGSLTEARKSHVKKTRNFSFTLDNYQTSMSDLIKYMAKYYVVHPHYAVKRPLSTAKKSHYVYSNMVIDTMQYTIDLYPAVTSVSNPNEIETLHLHIEINIPENYHNDDLIQKMRGCIFDQIETRYFAFCDYVADAFYDGKDPFGDFNTYSRAAYAKAFNDAFESGSGNIASSIKEISTKRELTKYTSKCTVFEAETAILARDSHCYQKGRKVFDFIKIGASIAGCHCIRDSKDYFLQNKQALEKHIIREGLKKLRFEKYGIPINMLKIGDITIAKNGDIWMILEFKDKIRELMSDSTVEG